MSQAPLRIVTLRSDRIAAEELNRSCILVVAKEFGFELRIYAVLDVGIIWNVVSQRALLTILGATVVLAWPLGRLLGRGVLGVVFVVILGATLAATTTTELPYYSVGGIEFYLREFSHPTDLLAGFASTDERLANIGLFVPLGSVATLLWHRPIAVVCACSALSFAIEGWQGFIGRGGEAVDVVHNSAGALVESAWGA